MHKRQLKNLLYEQVARIGKAVASPKRLELLELLAQGEKSVEQLALELSIDIKLASAHLRVLREARLVTFRKEGTFVFYQLAGDDVAGLWVKMHEVASEHLIELRTALDQKVAEPALLLGMDRHRLLHSAQRGDVVVLDVRPRAEYERAHLPFARSLPVHEIASRIAELPLDRDIVAYCRGPFCLFAEEACQLLARKGHRVHKLLDGVCEWQAAGMPLEAQ